MNSDIIINIDDINLLPEDVMTFYDDKFFSLVRSLCGDIVAELFRVQSINTTRTLLRMNNVFSVPDIDCRELDDLREKVRFNLADGTTIIKPGVINNVHFIINLLRFKEQKLREEEKNVINEKDMLYKLVQGNPLLKSLMLWYQTNEAFSFNGKQTFLVTFIDNITINLSRLMNNYRYHDLLKRFALALYILGGKYTYDFVRLNLIYALPCPTTINTLINKSNMKLNEAEFRFDLLQEYFISKNIKYDFASEDSTAIVKKIHYDTATNSFIGFCTLLNNGIPIAHYFRTESFDQLK